MGTSTCARGAHPSPEGGTTLTKDHPAILRIYDVGIWDSPHSKFEPILLGCFGEKIVFVFFGLFWCFWGSFSLSRAVSACFWPCICHQPTPDICLTHSDTILTLPDTLRHHPDTHQTPPCMRPLGERVISDNHDIYSTGFNLQYIYTPQTSE